MIVVDYKNVKLKLITKDDAEQLRVWRNATHVNEFMEYQVDITPEQQNLWLENLDETENLYFKIISSDTAIGVVNLKNIQWQNRTAEAGVFIGDKTFLNTTTPILAVIMLMRLSFDALGLKQLVAKISKHNVNAIQFNKDLGYTFYRSKAGDFDEYICTQESFYRQGTIVGKVLDLFEKNGGLDLSIDNDSPWLLEHLKKEQPSFRLHTS